MRRKTRNGNAVILINPLRMMLRFRAGSRKIRAVECTRIKVIRLAKK